MASQFVLSVLVTAHNCENYLADTLDSVRRACRDVRQAVEIVLVNDASADGTAAMLQAFAAAHPASNVFNVAYRNIGEVRNFGVQQCRGQYVTMLDGDDQLLPDALTEIVPYLSRQQPDMLLARLNEVYESRRGGETWRSPTFTALTRHQTIEKFLIHRELQAHFIGQFIRRDLLLQHRFPPFRCYEDAWLFPEILTASQHIVYADVSPYLYFKRDNSLSSKLDAEKISLLVAATQHMDEVLPARYRNLLSCHWINIAHKYQASLSQPADRAQVQAALQKIPLPGFLLDRQVRTSFKKKYLQLKLKKAF